MAKSEIYPREQAKKIIADHVCSKCWGHLIYESIIDDHNNFTDNCQVHCANSECDGEGFISKATVEKRKNEDFSNYYEAYSNLHEALGLTKEVRPASQVLKELGF